jgi:hypothetical protein
VSRSTCQGACSAGSLHIRQIPGLADVTLARITKQRPGA